LLHECGRHLCELHREDDGAHPYGDQAQDALHLLHLRHGAQPPRVLGFTSVVVLLGNYGRLIKTPTNNGMYIQVYMNMLDK
jgi:hypothetical protein